MYYRPRRWACNRTITVETGSGDQDGQVQSVSATGLGVIGVRGLAIGDAVTIRSDQHRIAGRVAWVDGTRAGIEFETPQTRAALAEAGLRNT